MYVCHAKRGKETCRQSISRLLLVRTRRQKRRPALDFSEEGTGGGLAGHMKALHSVKNHASCTRVHVLLGSRRSEWPQRRVGS